MARKPFSIRKPLRAKNKLHLVHADVCGPMQTESYGGNKFFFAIQ